MLVALPHHVCFDGDLSFQGMNAPLAPNLPPWGAHGTCDSLRLLKREFLLVPVQEIRPNRNLGMLWQRWQSPTERQNYYQMMTEEQK